MKHIITVVIVFITISLNGQWSHTYSNDIKCAHAKTENNNLLFNPEYNWQSKFLFDYDVTSYVLDLHVSDTSTFVSGNVSINAVALIDIDTFAFELVPEQQISNILVNGDLVTNFYRENDNVIMPIPLIEAGGAIVAKIYYEGKPPGGGFFTGVTTDYSTAWDKHVTWTLSEPFSAKQWFPVKQDLQDKADSAILNFTTSSTNMVGSEGLLKKVVDLGNGRTRYEWKTHYPIDYYLISFAVADYADYSIYAHPQQMNGDSLLIQSFLYNNPDNIDAKKESISKTSDIMDVFCDLFNLYPFFNEKYGHCETQLGGGMEHQTMSTMGNFSFHLIAHELGHMWFGDHVTCATWSDIWINEGFATYSDYLAHEFILGNESAKAFITKAQDHAMNDNAGSVYVPESEIYPGNEWRIFNGRLSYDKGASIIHMLRHEIQNDQIFFDILKAFMNEYGGGTATGEDFKTVAEEISGIDLYAFFNQWYYGQGFPIYSYKYWQNEEKALFISSTQTTSSSHTSLFELLMDYRINFSDGTDTLVRLKQTDNLNIYSLNFAKDVSNIIVDPDAWTLEQVSEISSVQETDPNKTFFTIGPNPTTDEINVYFSNNNHKTKLEVYSVKGNVLIKEKASGRNKTLNTSNLKPGIYTIVGRSETGIFKRAFVKI